MTTISHATNVATEVPRDRYGRPKIQPPEGGPLVPYTRTTTYVSAIEDTFNLSRWQQRMVALGLSERPDLLLAVAAHRNDKNRLNQLVEEASEAAKAHAAATTGTALHAITETLDRGGDPGAIPEAYRADIAAYQMATEDLAAVHIEALTVHDPWQIAGTPDRIVTYQGRRYIADLKTGSIEYGFAKIAGQLATYARSRLYDPATHIRTDHGADLHKGIVIHLPAGGGVCSLWWVDLTAGWEVVQTCRRVREQRAKAFRDLFTPVTGEPVEPLPAPRDPTIAEQISMAATAEEVRDLWRIHEAEWTPQLTALAQAHITELSA